ncbi:polysaccharide biosynthesis tyrosine autokinase [Acidocella sp. KAb 2-4]|uniref:polysaccharide biosynthesis tyrosine autokinase n=1 Tax=Acidocella sp. KAb 2-4 TaxID=2885158 RepID=UPI001D062B7F|nr:polysaccharide biosynthesis tyrosine autokinase [Acidocella sp. KAb 2-4]MCB5945663.1 hypothetical protein [Acidocella sp. KAb 2-4]
MASQLPAIGIQEAYDTADISQFLRTLRRRSRTIVLFTGLAGGAALLYTLFATPQFTARGALYLGDTQQAAPGTGDSDGTVNLLAYSTQSDVETQIELLTTGTLVERAVLESGLNATLRPAGKPPLTYWRWLVFHGGNTRTFLPGPQSLQVVDATLTGRYRLEIGPNNTYKLYVNSGLFGSSKPVLTGTIGELARNADGALLVRFPAPVEDDAAPEDLSAPTAPPTALKPGLTYQLNIAPPDALADKLVNGAFSVDTGGSPTQPTKLATLQFHWSDPYQAKIFVNQMMQDYIATQLQWKTEAASVTESFVTDQISKVSQQLAQADRSLSTYQAETGIVDPQQSAQAAVTEMSELQQQRAALQLKMQALRQLHRTLATNAGTVNQFLITEADDNLLSSLGTSLAQAEVKLSQLEAEYTQNSQDVQIQEAQVAELRNSISSLIRNDMEAAAQGLTDIDNLIGTYRDQLRDQPAEALKVQSLKRNSDQLGQLYNLLTQKAEQAEISKAATIIDTRVVTPSQLPLRATSPRPVITIIAGALFGFLSSLALIFAQHGFSGRFESEEQIRRSVALPIYGAVPRQAPALTSATLQARLAGPCSFNAFSEAFQLIKRNIYRQIDPSHAAAILVISANPQDGKTTIAANLAKSLADDGKRVLLMNCDIYARRPHGLASFVGLHGLTDWVRTGIRPQLAYWPGGGFRVLPAGTTKPHRGARLDEAALAGIIDTLSNEFDYLILDSPPLPIVSDGLLLGSFADLILSVVNVSHTMRRAFELHNELIEALDKPHGLVINGADIASYGDADAYFLGTVRRPKFTGWFQIDG